MGLLVLLCISNPLLDEIKSISLTWLCRLWWSFIFLLAQNWRFFFFLLQLHLICLNTFNLWCYLLSRFSFYLFVSFCWHSTCLSWDNIHRISIICGVLLSSIQLKTHLVIELTSASNIFLQSSFHWVRVGLIAHWRLRFHVDLLVVSTLCWHILINSHWTMHTLKLILRRFISIMSANQVYIFMQHTFLPLVDVKLSRAMSYFISSRVLRILITTLCNTPTWIMFQIIFLSFSQLNSFTSNNIPRISTCWLHIEN